MLRNSKLYISFEKLNVDYPEGEIVQNNDEFRKAVEEICDAFIHTRIEFSSFTKGSQLMYIFRHSSSIITRFLNADNAKPLDVSNFTVFMRFIRIITKLKTLVIPELIDSCFEGKVDHDLVMLNYDKEQNICDIYKSKLKYLRTNSDESEIYLVKEYFTYFLFEYIRMLSNLSNENVPLEKNIKLLLEVANDEMLAKHFHVISDFLPQTTKLLILKKITNCIAKPEFNLQSCEFLKSKNKDYKLEMCAVTFFTLQNICEELENRKINQSSQILSKFNVESIISLIDSPFDDLFEKTFEESTKCITFSEYQDIIDFPSEKIKKCLKILELLCISLRGHQKQIHNSPFSIVLVSILSDFIMATNLDNSTIMMLIEIIIGFLEISRLPMHFLAVSFAFNIYQKFKSNDELRYKLIQLFKSISNRLNKQYGLQKQMIKDFKTCIMVDKNWVDKAILISCFLSDIPDTHLITNTIYIEFNYALNEFVLLSSNYICSEKHLLVYPYAVSLNFSIVNQNEDCLFNNLSILEDYTTILFNEDFKVRLEDKKFLLNTICKHYEAVDHCLPKKFLLKCWEYVLNPINMDDNISKVLLDLCSSKDLVQFISILKIETIKIIEGNESVKNQEYYEYIPKLWSFLLNIPFINQKKKIRKDHINHFCFVINRTCLFNIKKIQTEQGLILLLKLACSLLQIPWINKTTMMNCSLRIMTFVEKNTSKSAQLLIEASELLIVLYKCPNNSIKPYLGLYVTTFSNFLNKCFSSATESISIYSPFDEKYCIPFHKLEKCSRLFKQNKSDFDFICRYVIEDIIEIVSKYVILSSPIMRRYFNIIFNLMDICSFEEMKMLMFNIQGPDLIMLRDAYTEYRENVRFTGRL